MRPATTTRKIMPNCCDNSGVTCTDSRPAPRSMAAMSNSPGLLAALDESSSTRRFIVPSGEKSGGDEVFEIGEAGEGFGAATAALELASNTDFCTPRPESRSGFAGGTAACDSAGADRDPGLGIGGGIVMTVGAAAVGAGLAADRGAGMAGRGARGGVAGWTVRAGGVTGTLPLANGSLAKGSSSGPIGS